MRKGYDIDISNLRKHYTRRDGTSVRAIDDISLRIEAGEFIVLLGPSGCGKTTLLRCLAGLETPDEGSVRVGDRVVFDAGKGIYVPPERRQIGMMFQSYALWPHLTIYENIRFPLKMQSVDKEVAAQRIERVLGMMHIKELVQQYPGQLSGGQQQRVALARAMLCSENLILFDEPLSNVDAKVREHLRTELGVMQRQLGFTAIYVTHDQDEAMALADRIVVLGEGLISQCGAPEDIYAHPADMRVADFIGLANFLPATIKADGDAPRIETDLGTINIAREQIGQRTGQAMAMSRPEHWTLQEAPLDAEHSWKGSVRLVTHLGPHSDYIVAINGRDIRIRDYAVRRVAVGDEVWCSIDPRRLLLLDAKTIEVR